MTIADFIALMQLAKGQLVTWTNTERQYTGTLRFYRFERCGWWIFKNWTVQLVLEVETHDAKMTKSEFFSLSSIDAISIGEGEVEFLVKRSWGRHYRFRFGKPN